MKTTPRYLKPTELTAICNAIDRVSGEFDALRNMCADQNRRNRVGFATVTEQIQTRRDIAKSVRKLDGLLSAFYTATACVSDKGSGGDTPDTTPEPDAGTVQPSEPETGAAVGVGY